MQITTEGNQSEANSTTTTQHASSFHITQLVHHKRFHLRPHAGLSGSGQSQI